MMKFITANKVIAMKNKLRNAFFIEPCTTYSQPIIGKTMSIKAQIVFRNIKYGSIERLKIKKTPVKELLSLTYTLVYTLVKEYLYFAFLSNLFACFSKLSFFPAILNSFPMLILKLQNMQKYMSAFFKKLLHLGHLSCFKLFQFISSISIIPFVPRTGLRKRGYPSCFSRFSRLFLRARISSFVSPYPEYTHALAPEDGALFRPHEMFRHPTSEVDLILPLSTREQTLVLSEGCKEKYFDRRARISPNHNHQSILRGCFYHLSLDFSNKQILTYSLFPA